MRTRLFLFALAIGTFNPYASAQWQLMNGPYGCTINCYVVHGTYLFAGTQSNGIFRSTDNGASWTAVNAGLTARGASCLATMEQYLFAGTSEGIFRSADNGTTWEPTDSLPAWTQPTALAVVDSSVFAGTNYGIFVSVDGGTTWEAASAGLPVMPQWSTGFIRCIASGDSCLFAGSDSIGVYLSTDHGATWTFKRLNDYTGWRYAVSALHAGGGKLFAGTEEEGVFLSTDNGSSWTEVNAGLKQKGINCLAARDSVLFAGTLRGVFSTTDNGAHWTGAGRDSLTATVNAIAVSGPNLLAGTSGLGTYRSTDNSMRWVQGNAGMPPVVVSALGVSGATLLAATDAGGIFLSAANGDQWTQIGGGWDAKGINLIAMREKTIIAGGPGVYISTHSDTGWTTIDHRLLPYAVRAFVVSDTVLYAGTSGGIFGIANDGRVTRGVRLGDFSSDVNALAISDTSLFVATRNDVVGHGGGVFCTTDGGASWAAVDSGIPHRHAHFSSVVGILFAAGGTVFTVCDSGLYASTDHGTSWHDAGEGIPDRYIRTMEAQSGFVFAGTDSGLFLSTDNGAHWRSSTPTVTSTWVTAIACSPTHVYAGYKHGGIWRRALSELTTAVHPGTERITDEFRLDQNFPDPFNPSTTIGYTLPARSYVSLTVFNVLGQQVALLDDGERQAGYHAVRMDGSQLPSGVYFYRLMAGRYSTTRRMLLVR